MPLDRRLATGRPLASSEEDALEVVIESPDYESAAKKMAAKIKDPEKRKAAEDRFLAGMKKKKRK